MSPELANGCITAILLSLTILLCSTLMCAALMLIKGAWEFWNE